jgi:hypothetical protein
MKSSAEKRDCATDTHDHAIGENCRTNGTGKRCKLIARQARNTTGEDDFFIHPDHGVWSCRFRSATLNDLHDRVRRGGHEAVGEGPAPVWIWYPGRL